MRTKLVDGKLYLDKSKYYTFDEISKIPAQYYIVYGKRNAGKTYSFQKEAVDNWIDSNFIEQFGLIRRFEDEIKQSMLQEYFKNDIIKYMLERVKTKMPHVEDLYIKAYARKWTIYALYKDENGEIIKEELGVIGQAFALNVSLKYKSYDYPYITTMCWEEFLIRPGVAGGFELTDEWNLLKNLVSTVKRRRKNFRHVYLLGNTVNNNSRIFAQLQIRARDIEPGTIKVYDYYGKRKKLTIVIEYTGDYDFVDADEEDEFLIAQNPRERMITDGTWEADECRLFEEIPTTTPDLSIAINIDGIKLYVYIYSSKEQLLNAVCTPSRLFNRLTYYQLYNGITVPNKRRFNIMSDFSNRLIIILKYLYTNDLVEFSDYLTGNDFKTIIYKSIKKPL